MRIEISQQCVIAGKLLVTKRKGKAEIYEVEDSLAEDSYFKLLVRAEKIKILVAPELKVDADSEADKEKTLAAEKLKQEQDLLNAKEIAAAKLELVELESKKNLSKEDKKRILEIKALIGA